MSDSLDEGIATAIFDLLTKGPAEIARLRLERIEYWLGRRKELERKELKLHAALAPDIAKILKGKKMLLFEEMLKSIGYKDSTLVQEMKLGFRVTGWATKSNVFNPGFRAPQLDVEELRSRSQSIRQLLEHKVKSSGDQALDEEIWKQTLEEEKCGWLDGPFTEQEMSAFFASDNWLANRRFGILQNEVLRLIDDYTETLVNATFGARDKVKLPTTDETAMIAKVLLSSVDEFGNVSVQLASGVILSGKVHPSLMDESVRRAVVGRTLDLTKAYRQLAASLFDQWVTNIVVFCPVLNKPVYFRQRPLAFGSCASVWSFNRCSRAIWALGVHIFQLLWSNFFDDYPHLDLQVLSISSRLTSTFLFDLLGWRHSVAEHKCLTFDPVFTALGVQFDFKQAVSGGSFAIGNKPGRVQKLITSMEEILASSRCTSSEASAIRGKLVYIESNAFGRLGRFAMGPIAQRSLALGGSASSIGPDLDSALRWMISHVGCIKPRLVSASSVVEPPLLLFTDGALEGEHLDEATAGAFVFDRQSRRMEHFGLKVPRMLLEHWRELGGSSHVIAQVELLPVLLARIAWPELFLHRSVIVFIDNNSVLFNLVSGYGVAQASRPMLQHLAELDVRAPSRIWFTRVSSEANPADGPSRLDFALVESFGCARIVPPCCKFVSRLTPRFPPRPTLG
ncbi:unnamed protein product [Polarella glacialis]|uniref:Uncharacterized protein n=1 Tax=Polarella glacialis TaxID=89957 RepID=A0A813D966_POLGL|nr:unnamed protein product [Polarella glacialis]